MHRVMAVAQDHLTHSRIVDATKFAESDPAKHVVEQNRASRIQFQLSAEDTYQFVFAKWPGSVNSDSQLLRGTETAKTYACWPV